MGLATYTYNRSTSGGEIIRELVNASDGQGLHFDGAAGTYVDCGDTTILDGATTISIEAIAATSGTAEGNIFTKSQAVHCYRTQFTAAGTIQAIINNGTSTVTATTSGTYNDGNPKHIVATWDNATISIYVNGNLDGTATLAGGSIPDTTDKLSIGAQLNSGTTNGSNFNGIIYRARLFNYVIDPTRFYENATVPFDDQYGSQTVLISVVTGLDGWDAANTWNSQTTAGSNMILSASASGQYCRTNATLGVGKKYRLIYTATNVSAASYFGGNWVGGFTNIHQIVDGTNTVDFTFEFATGFINDYFYCHSGDSTSTVTLSNLSLVEIGCAVDLDLAFANPTQSNLIQDRAGNADGTKKPDAAGGIVQVTPIEQLNSKSARIGTSAATPADGDLLVSGNVGIGCTPTALLEISKSVDSGLGPELRLYNPHNSDNINQITFAHRASGQALSKILSKSVSGGDKSEMHFVTEGADGVQTRITIADTGLTTVTNPSWPLKNEISNSGFDVWSNSTLQIYTDAGTGFTNLAPLACCTDPDDDQDNTTGWVAGTSAVLGSVAGGATGNCLEIDSAASAYGNASRVFTTTEGKLYKVSVWFKKDGSNGGLIEVGTAVGSVAYYTSGSITDAGWTQYTVVFEATTPTSYVTLYGDGTGGAQKSLYDDVYISEATPGIVTGSAGPDGWMKDSSDLEIWRQHKDATYTKDGSFYSLKIKKGKDDDERVYWNGIEKEIFAERYQGRTVTFGCWVYTTAASNVKVGIGDGLTYDMSSSYAGTSAWEWMEHTYAFPTNGTGIRAVVLLDGATDDVAYISQPMLCFSSAIGSGNYSRPSGEIVNCEKEIELTDFVGGSFSSATDINIEQQTSGKVPKGAAGLFVKYRTACANTGKQTALGSTSAGPFQIETYSTTADQNICNSGLARCDSDGDLSLYTQSGQTFIVTVYVEGVQLR